MSSEQAYREPRDPMADYSLPGVEQPSALLPQPPSPT